MKVHYKGHLSRATRCLASSCPAEMFFGPTTGWAHRGESPTPMKVRFTVYLNLAARWLAPHCRAEIYLWLINWVGSPGRKPNTVESQL